MFFHDRRDTIRVDFGHQARRLWSAPLLGLMMESAQRTVVMKLLDGLTDCSIQAGH